MKNLFLMLMTLILPHQLMASKEVGNGGLGVLIKDHIYLFDLYENGVEKDPFFNEEVKPNPAYLERLQGLDILSDEEKKLTARKLTELQKYSPQLSNYLILGVNLYVWRLLDRSLVEIPETSPIDMSGVQKVQLANRSGLNIRIDKSYWSQMDSKNRVALVLHELWYAFQSPTKTNEGCLEQQSLKVREFIGYIFSSQFLNRGAAGFKQISGYNYSPVTMIKNQIFEADFLSKNGGGIIASVADAGNHGFWKFCENAANDLKLKAQVSAAVSYRVFRYEVVISDFTSCSGPQKQLGVMQYPENSIQAGSYLFTKKNINTCDEWIENKSREVFSPFLNLLIKN